MTAALKPNAEAVAAPASAPVPGLGPGPFRRGFSLMELMVAIGIMAILSLIAYPLLSGHIATSRVKTDARTVDSVLQRARMTAAITQRPVRVVLNCARNVIPACGLSFQTAAYAGATLIGWDNKPAWRRILGEKSQVAPGSGPGFSHDGSSTTPGVYWAIFMPDSRVFSES